MNQQPLKHYCPVCHNQILTAHDHPPVSAGDLMICIHCCTVSMVNDSEKLEIISDAAVEQMRTESPDRYHYLMLALSFIKSMRDAKERFEIISDAKPFTPINN